MTHGAITIVNAIASGRGCALGISLQTVAQVSFQEGDGVEVKIVNDPGEEKTLAEKSIEVVLATCGLKGMHAEVVVDSTIPVGRGLKSSSAASTAIVMAALAALGRKADDKMILDLGIEASLRAGVTITGALDDAAACYYGGFNTTENYSKRLLARDEAPELPVILLVPPEKTYTRTVPKERIQRFSGVVEEIHRIATEGRYWDAMTLNGFVYSALFAQPTVPAIKAMEAGALAAGMSGTGPAVAAVCREEEVERMMAAWSEMPGRVIRTKTNNRKAEVISID